MIMSKSTHHTYASYHNGHYFRCFKSSRNLSYAFPEKQLIPRIDRADSAKFAENHAVPPDPGGAFRTAASAATAHASHPSGDATTDRFRQPCSFIFLLENRCCWFGAASQSLLPVPDIGVTANRR